MLLKISIKLAVISFCNSWLDLFRLKQPMTTQYMRGFLLVIPFSLTWPGFLMAADAGEVKQKWHTPFGLYLTPKEAYEMKSELGEKVAFIDIRTRAELKFVGFTGLVDANIPLRLLRPDYAWSDQRETFRTLLNPDFVPAVKGLLANMGLAYDSPVILMCQSGSRVPVAARLLHEAGFKRVYTQYQGFEGFKAKSGPDAGKRTVNGWKNADLPWGYRLRREKMYFNFSTAD